MRKIFWTGVLVFIITALFLYSDIWFGLGLRSWWTDIVEHCLGGILAGLIGMWWALVVTKRSKLVHALLGALILGIAVELVEYSFDWGISIYMSRSLDTAKDIVIDLIGGSVAWQYAKRWI
jgi:hypothetical protein